jgi:hypothetical protein
MVSSAADGHVSASRRVRSGRESHEAIVGAIRCASDPGTQRTRLFCGDACSIDHLPEVSPVGSHPGVVGTAASFTVIADWLVTFPDRASAAGRTPGRKATTDPAGSQRARHRTRNQRQQAENSGILQKLPRHHQHGHQCSENKPQKFASNGQQQMLPDSHPLHR